jgi:hypothetical protein
LQIESQKKRPKSDIFDPFFEVNTKSVTKTKNLVKFRLKFRRFDTNSLINAKIFIPQNFVIVGGVHDNFAKSAFFTFLFFGY